MSFYVIELTNKDGAMRPAEWLHLIAGGDVPITLEREGKDGALEEVALVQRYDRAALQAIVNSFGEYAKKQEVGGRWAGLLLDWDHFSSMADQQSDAAGWIMELQLRDDGIWGRIDWSDKGAAAVVGKQYKFASVTHHLRDCEMIGDGIIRPLAITKAALTNEPRNRLLKPYDVALLNRAVQKKVLDNAVPAGAESAAVKPQPTEESATMDFKAMCIKMLGLPETATDAEIQAACDAHAAKQTEMTDKAAADKAALEAANKSATEATAKVEAANSAKTAAEGEVAALKKTNGELLNALVDADLITHKAVIADPVAMKKQLLANRDGTLSILRSLKPAERAPRQLDNRGKTPDDKTEEPTGINRTAKAFAAAK